jgi:hypothetical protein
VTGRFDGSADLRRRRAAVLVAASTFLAGCRDPAVTQDAAQPPAVDASIAATPGPRESADAGDASRSAPSSGESPRTLVRTRGAISARFAAEKAVYALGEPMLVELDVSNTSRDTLVFDDRSRRYTWVVRNERGEVLCDSGRKGGRVGSEYVATIRLGSGETMRETSLLNPVCDAFAEAGRYVVSVRRSLSHERSDLLAEPACDDLEDASSPRDPSCADAGTPAPAVASRFSIEIAAWDAAALRARLATFTEEGRAAARAGDPSREGTLSPYGYWFCDHVRCDCPPSWNRYGDWLEKAIARVPEQMGARCRRR